MTVRFQYLIYLSTMLYSSKLKYNLLIRSKNTVFCDWSLHVEHKLLGFNLWNAANRKSVNFWIRLKTKISVSMEMFQMGRRVMEIPYCFDSLIRCASVKSIALSNISSGRWKRFVEKLECKMKIKIKVMGCGTKRAAGLKIILRFVFTFDSFMLDY